LPAIDAQGEGLGGECRTDVGGHVVITLVIVQIGAALAVAVQGTAAILRDHRIHPGLQIRQNPGIGVLIDGQTAAGVQAAQVQHAPLHASGTNPTVEFPVERGEAWAVGRNLDLVQVLLHRSALAGLDIKRLAIKKPVPPNRNRLNRPLPHLEIKLNL
jgi:hypothetical protein